jgi:hypothetical protein
MSTNFNSLLPAIVQGGCVFLNPLFNQPIASHRQLLLEARTIAMAMRACEERVECEDLADFEQSLDTLSECRAIIYWCNEELDKLDGKAPQKACLLDEFNF